MYSWFAEQNPVLQALLATLFTWFMTAAGAALALFGRNLSRRYLDGMLGMASGVMIAASYWSLLDPAIALAEGGPVPAWVPAAMGFLAGGAFLWLVDKLLPHLHPGTTKAEGVPSSWKRTTLLILAITLHNVPEGLAVGVAFGAAQFGLASATLGSAIALAIGIGLQNFPEGTAVSVPLRREGFDRWRAFVYGQATGMVEPAAGVIGAALVVLIRPLLPYAMAFAAGAMIYVVVEELIPESQASAEATDVATIGAMLGFVAMMVLDVALG